MGSGSSKPQNHPPNYCDSYIYDPSLKSHVTPMRSDFVKYRTVRLGENLGQGVVGVGTVKFDVVFDHTRAVKTVNLHGVLHQPGIRARVFAGKSYEQKVLMAREGNWNLGEPLFQIRNRNGEPMFLVNRGFIISRRFERLHG